MCAAAHGGQIVLSAAVRSAAHSSLPDRTDLRDLGSYRLKDFAQPQHIYQLVHADLPADFPPLRALPTALNNFPAERTSFVGRTHEVREVLELITTTRLVTLTGPGGTGKTRLSLQAAAAAVDRFPDGAWLIELASLSNPSLVSGRIASVLGIRQQSGRPIEDALVEACAAKRMLLLLDNCEHLIGACALIADRMLRSTGSLFILASSRQPLAIPGERVWAVPPLTRPDDADAVSDEDLERFDAPRLFVERALQADPAFELGDDDARHIASICRHLDGIPLAIELAAARIAVLSPSQIADRIHDRFSLLVGGPRGAPERHQTLRATIDWSHDLLTGDERILLRRSAIFPGGLTLDSAEHVCAFGEMPHGEILEVLTRLVNKSLLSIQRAGGAVRYQLNETTREYALERLDEVDEREQLSERLMAWAVDVAQTAKPHLRGPEQKLWLDLLDTEIDNIRAALSIAASCGHAETALSLASGLLRYWMVRGSWSEGQEWLRSALDLDQDVPPALRLDALRSAGVLADLVSDYDLALSYHESQLSLARASGDPLEIADALLDLARNAYRRGEMGRAKPIALEALGLIQLSGDKDALARGLEMLAQADPAEARRLLEQALIITRAAGDSEMVAGVLMRLGVILMFQGEFAASRQALEESLSISQQIGYARYVARCTQSLGELAAVQGDVDGGAELLREAGRLWPSVGHQSAMAEVVRDLGQLALWRGDIPTAASSLSEALTRFRELGMRQFEGWTLRDLGLLALRTGDVDDAETLLSQALQTAASLPEPHGIASSLEGLASVRIACGDAAAAARMLGSADAIREAAGMPLFAAERSAVDDAAAAARNALTEEGFGAAWAEGRATRLEDLLAGVASSPGTEPSRIAFDHRASSRSTTRTAHQAIFRRDGEYFTIAFHGPPFRMRDSKGLRYLARLLASPDREIHVLDLVGTGGAANAAKSGEVPSSLAHSDAGELVDAEATKAYRRRIADLRDDLLEAEEFNDDARATRARDEIEFLTRELAAGMGLGGRHRRAASTAERARVNVTRAIRLAIRNIARTNPDLARYLDTTVKTGTYCSYRPDTRFPTAWVL